MDFKKSNIYPIFEQVKKEGEYYFQYNCIDLLYKIEDFLSKFNCEEEILLEGQSYSKLKTSYRNFLIYSTVSKMRLTISSIKISLEGENFLTVFSSLRQLMELAITYSYYDYCMNEFACKIVNGLERKGLLEKNISFKQFKDDAIKEANEIRGTIKEKEVKLLLKNIDKFYYDTVPKEKLYTEFKSFLIYQAHTLYMIRTRYNLDKVLSQSKERSEWKELYDNKLVKKDFEDRKWQISIMDMLECMIEPIQNFYALNCDLVHPNKTSNLLILSEFKVEDGKTLIKFGQLDNSKIQSIVSLFFSPILHQTYYLITDTFK